MSGPYRSAEARPHVVVRERRLDPLVMAMTVCVGVLSFGVFCELMVLSRDVEALRHGPRATEMAVTLGLSQARNLVIENRVIVEYGADSVHVRCAP